MHNIALTICAITSVWVTFDARRHRIPSGKEYKSTTDAVKWLVGCLLLWILVFPVYLFKRAKTLRDRSDASGTSRIVTAIGSLCILAVVFCTAAPFFGWQRLSADELRDQVSQSIQNTWRGNAATQDLQLKRLILVRRSGNEYTGVATADYLGREVQYAVDVTYDGKTFIWKFQ
jgi:hypothetical protein